MANAETTDWLFQQAVSAIDTGNVSALQHLLDDYPLLVRDRLSNPGTWLRKKIGKALDGFFHEPYLLWFVAEDPVRNDPMPINIVESTRAIIGAAQRENIPTLPEQLNHTLLLVGWSTIAQKAGVQLALMDVLIDAGASPDPIPNNALVNKNIMAAKHAIRRGATLTLSAALCLGYHQEIPGLLAAATTEQKEFSLILAALNGQAEALRTLVQTGVDLDARSPDLYPHATALHQAVYSGSLEAVKVLVEGGADIEAVDTAFNGTPLGWALYGNHPTIATYLREKGARG